MHKIGWILILCSYLIQPPALGQSNEGSMHGEGWRKLNANGFIFLSQLDDEQTTALAVQLGTWKAAVEELISTSDLAVPTYVYLFETQAALHRFAPETAEAVLYPSPRGNYLAILNQPGSIRQGLHELAHQFINNGSGLHDPRWYEEGMAEYLSRLRLDTDTPTLQQLSMARVRTATQIDTAMPLEVLLFDNSGLASPLLVQVANAKAAMLLHFLLHAHQQDGFRDYREGLQNYLALLAEQRRGRYAFDRGFPVSLNRLAAEYIRYLQLENRNPESLSVTISPQPMLARPEDMTTASALGMLAELGLNAGFFELAEAYFQQAGMLAPSVGRYQSGLAVRNH
ncbi:MAG: hypothetical protein RQ757_07145 [Pseudomonadales bacterium]|nr:hypothetical protein [Pseudomonadales bacterium]